MRFKDVCENDMTSNKLTFVTVVNILLNKESKVTTIAVIPDESTDLEKVYYHVVYVMLNFKKENCVDRN